MIRNLYLGTILVASSVASCGSFDDPSRVYDMRILGAIADPPEILVPADLSAIDPASLPNAKVCVLVADPGSARELSYTMVACPKNRRGRCDAMAQPQIDLGSGTVGDPEEGGRVVSICETLVATPALGDILKKSISLDSLAGFGAIDIQVEIAVWPAGNYREQAIYGTKKLRFGVASPPERRANRNPSLDAVMVTRVAGGEVLDLALGPCGAGPALMVSPGEELEFLPVETQGAREGYVVPTLDGGSRSFTEILNYRFFTTEGVWSKNRSGGERDLSGMLPPLESRWTAPSDALIVGDGLSVNLYLIQRDERGGQSWTQSCIRVEP